MKNMQKKILIIYGTRPEIIKLAPLIISLKEKIGTSCIVVNTGQHADMTRELEKIFSFTPDYFLDIMTQGQSLNSLIVKAIREIDTVLEKEKPDTVIVQGDTTTVLAGGIASYYRGIDVGHVEAGLRSFNMQEPYPEEFNRKVISIFAKYNFVPTEKAKENLQKEQVLNDNIYITGNTVVDALQLIKQKIDKKEIETTVKTKHKQNILITAHRRENHGNGIESICKAVKILSEKYKEYNFYWPVHPSPKVYNTVHRLLANIDNVKLLPPLSYIDLIYLMTKSKIILTDSGGIQEEAPSVKKPVLILRNVTERPEVIDAGFGKIVGTSVNKIVDTVKVLLKDDNVYKKMISGTNPFGDGKASEKIINILLNE